MVNFENTFIFIIFKVFFNFIQSSTIYLFRRNTDFVIQKIYCYVAVCKLVIAYHDCVHCLCQVILCPVTVHRRTYPSGLCPGHTPEKCSHCNPPECFEEWVVVHHSSLCVIQKFSADVASYATPSDQISRMIAHRLRI